MKQELISVIMSTYNEPVEWINKSIMSVLEQSYKNLELIIVCDNPENIELIDILNEYENKDKRIVLIKNIKNMGLTKSLNNAIKLAQGKYIVRMDSDDIAEKTRIQRQYMYLKDNDLDLIGSGVVCIDENENEITKLNNFPKDSRAVSKKILYNNCLAHPTWFGKYEVFEKLSGYRDIDYAEDYDFLLRAIYSGFKLGNINELLLKYRIRESSISNQNGLKQFITSKVLVSFFKEGKISQYNLLKSEIHNELMKIDSKEEESYSVASKLFSDGVANMNPLKIFRAVVVSKFYRGKIICYIKTML